MQAAGDGVIVTISSRYRRLMAPTFLVFEAGKEAVIGRTQQLVCRVGTLGSRVNAICPSHVVAEPLQASRRTPSPLMRWQVAA